jgi:hypothetical protein
MGDCNLPFPSHPCLLGRAFWGYSNILEDKFDLFQTLVLWGKLTHIDSEW